MKFTHTLESYWDMLPPEIKEIILEYKESQEAIDKRKIKKRMKNLCREVKKYGELKRRWGIGHVKCTESHGEVCHICDRYHVKIVGYHEDQEGVQKEQFLGYNFKMALDQVDIVKLSILGTLRSGTRRL